MQAIHFAADAGEKSDAGLFVRAAAYIADCLILFAGLVILQAVLYPINPIVAIVNAGDHPTAGQLHLWVFATATVPFLLYFTATQSSARQATFGMRLLKLKIIGLNGGRAGFGRALLRSAVMLVPFELNHAVMFHLAPRGAAPSLGFWFGIAAVWILIGIYIGSIFLTRRGQSLHDLAASTVVRKTKF